MPWNYSSEGALSAARTRKAAPKLAQAAAEYRGYYLYERRGKWHVWDPGHTAYGPRWLPPQFSREGAQRRIDNTLDR